MVAAAAESLHQQLHIDVACRTSGNRHIIAAAERNNACMCADDGQQLVRCLCGRNAVYLLTGDSEDNALTAVARGRDQLLTLHILVKAGLEQALDIARLRTCSAQIRCRLKCADAGARYKALGIQINTRQHGFRLAGENAAGRHKILQQLADQLGGGRRIRLVQGYDCVLDIIRRTAVMVNDCDLVDGFEQRRTLHIAGTVYVHHDKQRVKIARDHRILGADEHTLVLRLGFQPLDQVTCHGVLTVHNNVHRSALDARGTDHTGSSADGVHIAVLVAHDQHLRRVADQLAECVGNHAALDLGALLNLFAQSAEEGKVEFILDNRLVAAAGQRHVDSESGKLIAFRKRFAVASDTDGQSSYNALVVLNLAHLLQNGELARDQLVQLGVFDHEDILVTVVLAQYGARVLHPGKQTFINARQNVGFFRVGGVLDQLLVVVDRDNRDSRTGSLSRIPQTDKLGAVDKMQHHQLPRAALHQTAEYMVLPLADAKLARERGLSLDEPAGLKRRCDLTHANAAYRSPPTADFRKCVIRPYDLTRGSQRDSCRQRRACHRRTDLSAVYLDVVHQFLHLPLPCRIRTQRNNPQDDTHHNTRRTVHAGEIKSHDRKQEKQHIKHYAVGSQHLL